MKQAALYARVSTQQQKTDGTIESQKKALLTFARENGYEIPCEWIFEDNGASGSTLVRPSLEKLRDFAPEGLFTTVFVLSPDRLARKFAYQALLLEEFKKHGVEVIFINSPNSDRPEGILLLQMQGMFAEYERAQITERSRRGKKYKAQQGCVSVLSKAPYGYRYIRGNIASPSYFEPVDREVQVVKTVFGLYTKEHLSLAEIQRCLLKKEISSPSGKVKWSVSTLNNMLQNSTYRGIAYYRKREKCDPDPNRLINRRLRVQGKHTSAYSLRKRNEEDWIPIPVPAIISEETFALSLELLERNKILSKRNTKEGTLLQGLIVCGECSYSYIVKRSGKKSNANNYYRCNNRTKKCENRGIRQHELDTTVWDSLLSLLKSPELIKKEVIRRISELKSEPLLAKKRQLEASILKLKDKSNRLLDAYQAECLSLDELRNRMDIIKRESNILRRQLQDVDTGVNRKQLVELEDAIEYFSNKLESSEDNLSLDEKRKILRMLVRDIIISKNDITINHILPLAEGGKSKNARLSTGCRWLTER